MNSDNTVTLTKTDPPEGSRVAYRIHLIGDFVGLVYQPHGSRSWWIRDHRDQLELWQFRTRQEAVQHFTGVDHD